MRHYSVLMCLIPMLAACATMPRAEIGLITSQKDLTGKELDSYAFPRSFVDIRLSDDETDYKVSVSNKSYESFRIALRRNDKFGVKTNLNLSKITNSDMLDEAGVQIFDNRAKIIGEIGKLATTLVGIAVKSEAANKPDLPVQFDSSDLLSGYPISGDGSAAPKALPNAKGIRYWFGPVQPDARPVLANAFSSLQNGLVYASCRELRLYIEDHPVVSTYVSDPRYFRYVAFPQKGKVKIHPQCGTSVTSEKDDSISSDAAIGNAVLDEVKKLKEAIEKKNEDKQ